MTIDVLFFFYRSGNIAVVNKEWMGRLTMQALLSSALAVDTFFLLGYFVVRCCWLCFSDIFATIRHTTLDQIVGRLIKSVFSHVKMIPYHKYFLLTIYLILWVVFTHFRNDFDQTAITKMEMLWIQK